MKKLILSGTILTLFVFQINAQQLPLYSQYMLNGFLLNPGITGSTDNIPIRLTVRNQWTGITDAPMTQAISAHSKLPNKNMGVGGYIFNDSFGPISSTGVQVSYAYHILVGTETNLGLGLSISAFQFKLDETELTSIEQDDLALSRAVESTFVPDANFGAYLYNEKYFAGIAGSQLIQYKVEIDGVQAGNNQMIRHYYLTGGYNFRLNDNFILQPSLLAKGTERSPAQLDVNAKAVYKDNYWLAVSYRTSQSAIAMIGIKYDRYYIGYAFDYSFSNLRNYSTGSHEFMLGIDLGKEDTGSSLL